MERENFENWLIGKPDWKEISDLYNSGRAFQHKQDMKAVFGNSFRYIESKFKAYYKEFNRIPVETLDSLVYEFRQHFPIPGRIDGIPYYDDLILAMIERYKQRGVI